MAMPCTRERNLLSHPGPSPSAPAGSSGPDSLRNPVINSNKFACLSCIIMFHLNWLGIKQLGQREASVESSRGVKGVPLMSTPLCIP